MSAEQTVLHPHWHARRTPHKPALILAGNGRRLSYGDLEAGANRAAHLLRALGLRPGDGVVALLGTGFDYFVVYWATQRIGCYFTPVSTQFQQPEIAWILGDCDARVLVTSSEHAQRLSAAGGTAHLIPHRFTVDGACAGFDDWQAACATQSSALPAGACEGADMLYSSGTTGQPKGVRNAAPGAALGTVSDLFRRRLQWQRMDAGVTFLSTAPLYHSAPLRYGAMALRSGATAVLMERFDAEAALAAIARHGVTHSQWVPTMFVRLLRLDAAARARHDLGSHRFAVHAAAPCPIAVKEQMLAWWGPIIHEYYSGTEGNGQTVIGPAEWLQHKGSVGRAIHGRLHIVGELGSELATGEDGLVCFEGGSGFSYYKDAAKTRGAYDQRGWSTLGDIGHLDRDGYLYLTGRQSLMIITGGVNVYPQEVENVLLTHPSVGDAAVFGIPDAEFGEQVRAAVELTAGHAPAPALAADLIAFCRARLAHLKCPRTIDFVDSLPRHATGKLYRQALRDPFWPAAAGQRSGPGQ